MGASASSELKIKKVEPSNEASPRQSEIAGPDASSTLLINPHRESSTVSPPPRPPSQSNLATASPYLSSNTTNNMKPPAILLTSPTSTSLDPTSAENRTKELRLSSVSMNPPASISGLDQSASGSFFDTASSLGGGRKPSVILEGSSDSEGVEGLDSERGGESSGTETSGSGGRRRKWGFGSSRVSKISNSGEEGPQEEEVALVKLPAPPAPPHQGLFDTFVKKDGSKWMAYNDPSGEGWMGVDYKSMKAFKIPQEWIDEGGQFASVLSSYTPSSTTFHTTLLNPLTPPSTDLETLQIPDPNHPQRKCLTRVFPVLRKVRYILNEQSGIWTPLDLDKELDIPQVSEMVDTFLSTLRSSNTSLPSFHSIRGLSQREKRQREREEALKLLRGFGYDIVQASESLRGLYKGEGAELEDIADQFLRKLEDEERQRREEKEGNADAVKGWVLDDNGVVLRRDSGVEFSSGAKNQVGSLEARQQRDTIRMLRERVVQLEDTLKTRDQELSEAHEKIFNHDIIVETLRNDMLSCRDTLSQKEMRMMNLSGALENAVEKIKHLTEELETLRMDSHAAKVNRMYMSLCDEKDAHIDRLRFNLSTLQQKLASLQEARRKETVVLRGVRDALSKLRSEHLRFQMDVRAKMENTLVGMQRIIRPLLDRMEYISGQHIELRNLQRVESLRNDVLEASLKAAQGPLKVVCRVRADERVRISGKSAVSILGEYECTLGGVGMPFRFDRVMGPGVDQAGVYRDIAPLVVDFMKGANVAVVAYGQTGAGKTFTMQGTPVSPGISVMSIKDIYRLASENTNIECTFSATCLEVYNEKVYDLFGQSESPLEVLPAKIKPSPVAHLCPNVDTLLSNLHHAHQTRAMANMKGNHSSSRSHLILSLSLQAHNILLNTKTTSRFTLIDLAGSDLEGVPPTIGGPTMLMNSLGSNGGTHMSGSAYDSGWSTSGGSSGMGVQGNPKMMETLAIQESLESLHEVLRGVNSSVVPTPTRAPVRESALTRLFLNPDFGGLPKPLESGGGNGGGKVVVVVCVSPLVDCAKETEKALVFGHSLKEARRDLVGRSAHSSID
ncbi:hypothetical protein HDV05_000332 [Chytridiales sp. JEL 0842]|nr:hypothetical protein HDV05_000332 [Chytridiales sp. JEL 0842]